LPSRREESQNYITSLLKCISRAASQSSTAAAVLLGVRPRGRESGARRAWMERGTEFATGTGGAAAGRVFARPDSFRPQGASRRRPVGTRGEQEATPAGGAAQFSSFIPQTCPPWPRAKEPHMAAARPRLEAGPPASTGAVTQARAGRQRDRARRRSRRRAPERSFVLACGGGATGAHRSGGSSSRVEAGPSARTGAAARPRASFPPSSPSTSTSTRRMCRSVTSLVSSSSSPTAVQASCSMECRCCAPDFFCVVASRRFASIWNASHSWRSHFFVFSSVLCARCKSCFASPVCNTLLELQATHI
jgi:hypothetical protein